MEDKPHITKTEFHDRDGIFGWIMGEGNIQTEGKGLLKKISIFSDGNQVVESKQTWLDKTTGRAEHDIVVTEVNKAPTIRCQCRYSVDNEWCRECRSDECKERVEDGR